MHTENLPLDIKEIFDRKKVSYCKYDIARMRYLCKQFVEFVLETQKNNETKEKRGLPLEARKVGRETARIRWFYGRI